MTLGWPWPILWQVKFGNLGFSIGKSESSVFFRHYCSLWPESWLMQTTDWTYYGLLSIVGQGYFWTMAPGSFHMKVKTFFSEFQPNFVCKLLCTQKWKFIHMAKMAAMPLYGKNTVRIFFPETIGQILMKLGMKHQQLKPIIFCSN